MRIFTIFLVFLGLNADILQSDTASWLGDTNLTCQKFHIDTTKHPEFRAYIEKNDGTKLAFASVKSMFAFFYDDIQKIADVGVKELFVTDFYSGEIISASDAFYVFGSRIMSAKGDDLIPFKRLSDAQKFQTANSGHKILEYKEIKKRLIDYLR